MANYTYKMAIRDLLDYLGVREEDVTPIDGTLDRGFEFILNQQRIVIFTYPISCKENNKQNFFDTRDSGADERKIAWNYAVQNGLKYFCLGVNSEQERYKNYILSLESSEEAISKISYRKSDSSDKITGTQVNIPADFIPNSDFERILTPKGFYISAIKKDFIKDYLLLFDNRPYGYYDNEIELNDNNLDENDSTDSNSSQHAQNIIYYGVPGSGKSHMIDKLLNGKDLPANRKRRVVFHPDYSNADFVGQILPTKKDGKIEYEFKEGPFTSILKAANESEDDFYLVIEEINRGNAAAIFGDIFQLLDRDDDGGSKFEISNKDIWQSIHGKEKEDPEGAYNVRLPRNLSILATMNTSDQNVFTLDNAFQRRWNMIHVKNEFRKDGDSTTQRNARIEGTSLTWEQFLFGGSNGNEKGINEIISESSGNKGMSSLEDKRLGCWFVINKDGIITKDDFSNKVLKYLWDDAFHLDKTVFSEGISSFDELVDAFEKKKPLFNDFVMQYDI